MTIWEAPITQLYGSNPFAWGDSLHAFIPGRHPFSKLGFRRKVFTAKINLLSFKKLRVGLFSMLAVCCVQLKVIGMIVGSVVVNVMNSLLGLKDSTNLFFHNNSMLSNIPLFLRQRVFGAMNIPVAFSHNTPTFIGRGMASFSESSVFFPRLHSLSVNPCSTDVKGAIW